MFMGRILNSNAVYYRGIGHAFRLGRNLNLD